MIGNTIDWTVCFNSVVTWVLYNNSSRSGDFHFLTLKRNTYNEFIKCEFIVHSVINTSVELFHLIFHYFYSLIYNWC